MVVLSCHCCMGFFSGHGQQGLLSHCSVQAPLCSGASCCRAQAPGRAGFRSCSSRLQSTGSVVVVHRLSCSAPCGIFPDQGWSSCLLRWQEDASPLSHWGRPYYCVLDCFLVSLYGVCIIRR